MTVYNLKTPILKGEIAKLRVDDVVYLTGKIVTARGAGHKRALEFHEVGKKLPLELEGLAVYHCGPIAKKVNSKWSIVAAGPTTSARMDRYEDEFIKNFGVRVVIGKGGMGRRTTMGMQKYCSVYCAFTGGAAVLAAKAIKEVERVEWLDLGMAEALWILKVEDFGPLIVAIDSHGNNLFWDVERKVEKNRNRIYRKLGVLT